MASMLTEVDSMASDHGGGFIVLHHRRRRSIPSTPFVSLKTGERQIKVAKLTMSVMVKMITISDHDQVRFPNPLAD